MSSQKSTVAHGFPANPVDGEQHEFSGWTYEWDEERYAWKIASDPLGRFLVSPFEPKKPVKHDLWWDMTTDTLKCYRETRIPGQACMG